MANTNDKLYEQIRRVINYAFRRLDADQRFDLAGETYAYFLTKTYTSLPAALIIRKASDIAGRELQFINNKRYKNCTSIEYLGDNVLQLSNPLQYLTPHVAKTTRLMEKLALLAPYSNCLSAVFALYRADADVDEIRDKLRARGSSSLTCMLRREIAEAEKAMTIAMFEG